MTSSNGNIFRVTGHLCGELTGPRWIPSNKGQRRGDLMLSLICVWINGWVKNLEAGDLRRYRAHYDVIVMTLICRPTGPPPPHPINSFRSIMIYVMYETVISINQAVLWWHFQFSRSVWKRLPISYTQSLRYSVLGWFVFVSRIKRMTSFVIPSWDWGTWPDATGMSFDVYPLHVWELITLN